MLHAQDRWDTGKPVSYTHLADVNKRYQPAVEVVGDISESVYEILRCARRGTEPEFALELRRTMEAEHEAMANDDSCPMKPARILADVRKVMGCLLYTSAAVQAGLGDVLEHTVDDVITQLLLVGHTGLDLSGSHFKSLAHASDAGHVLRTLSLIHI